ncbi:MAG TPA: tetratricopeptide repeat protein [Pyrinomonadaceae bacterium]|nr:tetratricopeptide repeat protein [Pyrinomonadaceae bacterium]
MRSARVIIFSIVVLLATSASAAAQGSNTLQGRVIAPDGSQPAAPVKVTLTYSGRRIYETFTDLSGRFFFSGLKKGTYELTAEGDDKTFVSTSVTADVGAFGSGQLLTQDIQVRPIANSAVNKPGVVSGFYQPVPKAAREALERALELRTENKKDASLEKLQQALRIFPAYFEAHLELGNHFLQAGEFDKAIAQLDEARLINPNDERLYQSFGLILMQQKNYTMAVAIFAEASRLNPTNPMNTLMRATALIYEASNLEMSVSTNEGRRRDLLQQAESALSQAGKLSDNKLTADYLTLAVFYDLKGEPARAADELENYLQKKPDSKNAEAIKKEIARLRAKVNDSAKP